MLLNRVRAYISRHFLLTHRQTLVVGVSGGPDSITLLHLLTRLRSEYGLKLIAAHLNHGLRAEADGEAEFVCQTASAWDVECVVERADVAALAKAEHLSVEEAGRRARYAFFARVAPIVAVAHNADDQVETVLMHLLRGSGMAGLRGMLPKSRWLMADGQWQTAVRPLLAISRPDIETYLAAHDLEYRIDATNTDTTFFRNRLRHELIPVLETYNPNLRGILFRTADVMAGEYELLLGVFEKAWDETVARSAILSAPQTRETSLAQTLVEPESLLPHATRADRIAFNLLRWRSLPLALQRALLREAVHRLRPGIRNVDFTPIDSVVHWSHTAESGHTADLLGGLCVSIAGPELRVESWDTTAIGNPPSTISHLVIPGTTLFLSHAFTAACLDSFSLAEIESNPDRWTAYLDADLGPFVLRTRRPGDHFQPLGMTGSAKLSDFMINRKILAGARDTWPLLACGENGDTVLWVCGYAVSERSKVRQVTKTVVRVVSHLQKDSGDSRP